MSMNTDFTKMPRAGAIVRAKILAADPNRPIPFDLAVLDHEERRLRRRVVELVHGDKVLVDLAETVQLNNRDVLVLDDGRHAEIIAAEEQVYEILGSSPLHLGEMIWHLGRRRAAVDIQPDRLLILRDAAAADMLRGLGATVTETSAAFHPIEGGKDHRHQEDDAHRDAYGRRPGDPHYGHNHGPGHGHHDDRVDRFGRLPGDPHYGHDHA